MFLVHPGGPFYQRKDEGAWTIPKGEIGPDEEPFEVARREFAEETGQCVEVCARNTSFLALGTVRQKSGKVVQAWAFEGDWPEGARFSSNRFTMEWPPRSGRMVEFSEVDRGEFFSLEHAKIKANAAQVAFLDRLRERLGEPA